MSGKREAGCAHEIGHRMDRPRAKEGMPLDIFNYYVFIICIEKMVPDQIVMMDKRNQGTLCQSVQGLEKSGFDNPHQEEMALRCP